MPRSKRVYISREIGVYHITSRVAGGDLLFGEGEKEYFLKLLERFASGFYVIIHSFAIMTNHFHLLVSERTEDTKTASVEELIERYHLLYGQDAEPPIGRQKPDGSFIPDEDGGIERLRVRLTSVSRFVQELKQTFSHWFNIRHNRKGYLWGERFGGLPVERGDAALISSAYIDLNAIRAGIVKTPEAYRWCSLGLFIRDPGRAKKLLNPLPMHPGQPDIDPSAYRLFVYRYGEIPVWGKAAIDPRVVAEVEAVCGRLGILQLAKYRIRNLSEGIALGSHEFVAAIQLQMLRKIIPHPLTECNGLYCSRVLSSP